jgi:pilus assembly protein CpaB
MNVSRVLVLLVALGASGMAALLLGGFFGGKPKVSAAPAAAPTVQMAEVLVASKDIDVGHTIASGDLKWQKWPKDALADQFIVQEVSPDALEGMTGAVARTVVFAGEPATSAKLIRADSANFMAATLTPGMRAVSVVISEETGAGGFILPNDHVDIVVTPRQGEVAQLSAASSRTLLQDIRVLAVGQRFRDSSGASDQDGSIVQARTATLEVSPQEAEMLQQAAAAGTLSLSLRGLSNPNTAVGAARVPSGSGTGASGTVTVIRYGEVQQMRPGGR